MSEFGKISTKAWFQIPDHFSHVKIDAFIVMPNHIHGILQFERKALSQKANSFDGRIGNLIFQITAIQSPV